MTDHVNLAFAGDEPRRWGVIRRVLFRFALLYVVLYAAGSQNCFPLSLVMKVNQGAVLLEREFVEKPAPPVRGERSVPQRVYTELAKANQWVMNAWSDVGAWVDRNVLRNEREIPGGRSGSGDRLGNWLRVLGVLLISGILTLVWSLIDRWPRRHWRLLAALTIFVRYYLAYWLFAYGFIKLVGGQFSPPGFWKLEQSYGDASPMGILWTFMGASTPYTIFGGAGEVLAGFLLLFRRTATLGALTSIAVMGNVAAMNYCYDVPVKLFSTHLLLISGLLVLFDARRVLAFFAFNRDAPAAVLPRPFTGAWWPFVGYAVKLVVVGAMLYTSIKPLPDLAERMSPTPPPHHGMWEVEEFTRNGDPVPPLLTDATRWRRFAVEFPRFGRQSAVVWRMNGTRIFYSWSFDEESSRAKMAGGAGPMEWQVERPDDDTLILTGKIRGDDVTIRCKHKGREEYELVKRDFHWISDMPYNR